MGPGWFSVAARILSSISPVRVATLQGVGRMGSDLVADSSLFTNLRDRVSGNVPSNFFQH